jgi:hypothetical protein
MSDTGRERLEAKIKRVLRNVKDGEDADRALSEALGAQELLTLALLPKNSRLRTGVLHALAREEKRKKKSATSSPKKVDKEEDLIPISLPIGKGATMVVMTRREDA